MTPPRSKPFEAAVRAGCESSVFYECKYPSPEREQPKSCNMAKLTRAILAAALPPDPAPETVTRADIAHAEELWKAIRDQALGFTGENKTMWLARRLRDIRLVNLRAFRASLLPGEELS